MHTHEQIAKLNYTLLGINISKVEQEKDTSVLIDREFSLDKYIGEKEDIFAILKRTFDLV
jgi:hypothetical protein